MEKSGLTWKKSTLSEGGGECVEVAMTQVGVLVRDSKNPSGPVLWFTRSEWLAFRGGVLQGEFDLS